MVPPDSWSAWQTDLEARRSIEEHLEEFAQIESLDNGKPLSVARVADVPLAVDLFRYMAGWTTKIEGQTLSTRAKRCALPISLVQMAPATVGRLIHLRCHLVWFVKRYRTNHRAEDFFVDYFIPGRAPVRTVGSTK